MSSLSTYLVQTGASLLVLGGIAWLLMRFRRARAVSAADSLELVSRLSLDPRRAVYLVRAKDQMLVIGASEGGLRLLQNLTTTEARAPAARTLSDAAVAGTLASAGLPGAGPSRAPTSSAPTSSARTSGASERSPDGQAAPSLLSSSGPSNVGPSNLGPSNVGLTSEPFSDPESLIDLGSSNLGLSGVGLSDVGLTSEPFSEPERPDSIGTDSIGLGSSSVGLSDVGLTSEPFSKPIHLGSEEPQGPPPESAARFTSADSRVSGQQPASVPSSTDELSSDAAPHTAAPEASLVQTLMSKRS